MAELPVGTVTFLFTDIEGSTKLLRQLRDRYGEVLAEHQRLLREVVEAAGGQEIDTQGDAFFFAFRRARDGLQAAVKAQHLIAEHEWPEGVSVRVRMGLHTGEPAATGERYVGMGVHRAARIMAAGHGGQVLLSNATRELIEDDLPPGVELRDLGEQRLKDIDRPERIFQLVADGLPREFPPLRTAEEPAAFVGREEELAVAAGEAVQRRLLLRRRPLIAAGALALAGVVAAVVVLTQGGSTAGAAGISANSVGLIDSGGHKVRKQVSVQESPTSVAIGEGGVWVTNANNGSVSRIDPASGSIRQTIAVGSSPSGIAVGGGSVWVANHDDGTVSRIDPTTNGVVQTVQVGHGPTAIAYGEGAVWVTNSDDRTLSRVDPESGNLTKTVTTDAVGRGVTVGAGSVWVTDESTRTVARIDAASGQVTDTINVGNGPTGIAYGAGAVWVANSLDSTLSRIAPSSGSVTATIRLGGAPSAVAVGDGFVWVSVEFGERVLKIDPTGQQPRIEATLKIGNRPEGLAVTDNGVWVAVQASGRGHRGGRLVVLTDGFATVDPAFIGAQNSAAADALIYDALVAPRRAGGAGGTQLVPDLAASIPAPANNGTTYTFRLRQGIRYSNGSPVRPADFRRGIERAVAGQLFPPGETKILGSDRCSPRSCDLSQGITTGSDTVTIRLTAPNPRLVFLLTLAVPTRAGTPLHALPGKALPGTGPYMVGSFVPNRELLLVRNPRFRVWSAAARPDGYPDEIDFRMRTSTSRQLDEVVSGHGDIALDANVPARIAELKTRYASRLHFNPQNATTFVFLNVRKPPFNDIRVRRAVNLAVDRAKMAALEGGPDLAQPTCQVVPPPLPGYVRFCSYTAGSDSSGAWHAPDLERARKLISASHTGGEQVVVWTFEYFAADANYFVSLLKQLGYRARLKTIAGIGPYFDALAKTHPQAGFGGWFGLVLPSDVFITLGCHFDQNWADFCDPAIDSGVRSLIQKQGTDPTAERELAAALDRKVMAQAPWVPLWTPKLVDFTSSRVGNYQYNPYLFTLLDQLWVK